MKTIGLIGGMSWESTAEYYKEINLQIKKRLGGLHSGKILLYSVDFSEIEKLQHRGDWEGAAKILVESARSVEAGGADCLLLCTNTMHKVADSISGAVKIPFLHIATCTGKRIESSGIKTVGLLGTRFTMEEEFYRGSLNNQYGLNVLIPSEIERKDIHRIIYDELCKGIVREESRDIFKDIMIKLQLNGAEGIILGCTEIGLLVKEGDSTAPLFDTTRIHAEAAVDFALG